MADCPNGFESKVADLLGTFSRRIMLKLGR
jgi:hypothetical protein